MSLDYFCFVFSSDGIHRTAMYLLHLLRRLTKWPQNIRWGVGLAEEIAEEVICECVPSKMSTDSYSLNMFVLPNFTMNIREMCDSSMDINTFYGAGCSLFHYETMLNRVEAVKDANSAQTKQRRHRKVSLMVQGWSRGILMDIQRFT